MNTLIYILTSSGVLGFVGYIAYLITKIMITNMICQHPELSDDKVQSITRMISKDKRKFFQ